MNHITQAIRQSGEYRSILSLAEEIALRKGKTPAAVTGLCEDARKAFIAAFGLDTREKRGEPILCILPDEKEANRLEAALTACGLDAVIYPSRDFNFHNITASHEYEHERLSVLNGIVEGRHDMILTVPDALLQYTIPSEVLIDSVFTLRRDHEASPEALVRFLSENGYIRVDMVDGVGQFSQRGGILDVFPPFGGEPVRIEFFDTEVERIASFDPLTQRKNAELKEIDLIPAREVLVSAEQRKELSAVIDGLIKKCRSEEKKDLLREEKELVKSGADLPFIDKYISLIYPQKECLLDYFSEDALFLLQDYNAVKSRIEGMAFRSREAMEPLAEDGVLSLKSAEHHRYGEDLEHFLSRHFGLMMSGFSISLGGMRLSGSFSFTTRQTVSVCDNFPLLREELDDHLRARYKILLSCESRKEAQNLRDVLMNAGIVAFLSESVNDPEEGRPLIVHGEGAFSFEMPTDRFVCLSLYRGGGLYGSGTLKKGKKAHKKKSAQEKILSYADIKVGDYVVHDTHGIGRYMGLQTLSVEGFIRDFVKIQYAGSDMLYLPCNQLDSLAKYIGSDSDNETLRLSRMGGSEWGKTKQRVKSAAKDMAKDLIDLYARRLRKPGYAFSADDAMQKEFEEAFPYEETDGQLEAIEDIKRDMQQRHPMDRLLCGDVGFGKTEVALRAAFKAVSDSKQVAILVPTTILALQHYQTLCSRMRAFPVRVDMLSRFRSKKEQTESLRKLKRGETDIIVGTHRLVSKDVEFKDLGLVIIDEEQRFGVAHKEHLKQLSENVDVLTLTATPIPRTMNMAMSGIRDMSVLEEAPQDRQPVQSYVTEYDETILREAIQKELRRGGQVFYLHNNIDTIDACAARVAAMAPDARIATAHGQMDKEYLSDIWRELIEGQIDIFVCTTIIETGVDVPNANTLIIENADRMGLSQLHQIRGRIGRSSRRAYAYFTFGKGKVLTEIAVKRLSAIREYAEFGSGFKVALRDMEIRGAGNLLGEEQHGHMAKVGYDMYMKLLNEAILEEKGELKQPKPECTVDIKVDAYIPERYIKSGMARVDAYKKIALIRCEEDRSDIADELNDRFGKMPPSVSRLLDISLLRSLGSESGMKSIEYKNGCLLFYPHQMNASLWARLIPERQGRLLLNVSSRPYASLRVKSGEEFLNQACALLSDYLRLSGEEN